MSKEDLIPYKPGQSGNPAGKKKGTKNSLTYLKEAWAMKVDSTDPKTGRRKKMPTAMIAAIAQIQRACKGDTSAYKEILDRIEGKVAQPMEHAGAGGIPLAAPIIQVELVPGGEEGE